MPKQTAKWMLGRLAWVLALLAGIWVVEGMQVVTGRWMNTLFGLIPREIVGLDGVAMMPFLHGSVAHAVSNTVPLVVLGTTLVLTATRSLWAVNAVIVLLGGGLVWLFGQTAIHVGASGLVFGWFAFLIARGIVDRRPVPLIVAVAVGVIYGALIFGVLPGQDGVSWESHLFGAIAGVTAAVVVPCRLRVSDRYS